MVIRVSFSSLDDFESKGVIRHRRSPLRLLVLLYTMSATEHTPHPLLSRAYIVVIPLKRCPKIIVNEFDSLQRFAFAKAGLCWSPHIDEMVLGQRISRGRPRNQLIDLQI